MITANPPRISLYTYLFSCTSALSTFQAGYFKERFNEFGGGKIRKLMRLLSKKAPYYSLDT